MQEERVVLSLIEDLQVGLALDLDEAPCMNRSPGPPESTGEDVFLVVGSSNARRLVAVMERKVWQTVLSDSWRATKKSVSDMANNILEEKEKRKYTAIIFMLLDNNMFFGQSEDGSRGLPKKEADGRYHAEGVIHLADKDGQYAILKLCEPIWETAKDLNMVIISPMARYVTAGCCDNPGHMSNRGKPDFYHQMKLDLVGCAQNIKNFLFTGGLRNGRVMDPARTTRDLAVAEIWGDDPIHPRDGIYSIIVDSVREVEKSCGSGKKKRKLSADGNPSTSATPTGEGQTSAGQRRHLERGSGGSWGGDTGNPCNAGMGGGGTRGWHGGGERGWRGQGGAPRVRGSHGYRRGC